MSKTKIKFGIYTAALLMMGAIGISSSLSVIGRHFPDASQTMITSLISIPCLVVIPVTLLSGFLMEYLSKKTLLAWGILFFLCGGIIPAVLTSFTGILVLRGIFGIGIGLIQTLTSALVAEYFEGFEKERVQGNAASAQMLGCIIMSFVGGRLGIISWNAVFWVHALALIPLVLVLAIIPGEKPEQKSKKNKTRKKKRLPFMTWFWASACLLFFMAAQAYSNSLSFFIAEKGLGTAAQSGNSLSFFAFGGFLMGIVFGRLMDVLRKLTLTAGFLLLAAAYLIIAFSNHIFFIYSGSMIAGLSVSTVFACIMVESGNSVSRQSSGLAVAVATCFQNIGMFLSPYIVNPAGRSLNLSAGANFGTFIFCIVIMVLFGICSAVWGIRQNKIT